MFTNYQYTMHDTLPYIFRKKIWFQPVRLPLHCWRWITRAPEIAIYLSMYLCASFHCSCVNAYARGTHSSAGPPWTKLVWTAVILNGSEASGLLTNGRALKMYSWAVYKSFETKPPSAYGPVFICSRRQQMSWMVYAWLPQVRMINQNVAVILDLFLCFEWMCAWPHTSGKVLPLPTTRTQVVISHIVVQVCHTVMKNVARKISIVWSVPNSPLEWVRPLRTWHCPPLYDFPNVGNISKAHLLHWEFSQIVLSHVHSYGYD